MNQTRNGVPNRRAWGPWVLTLGVFAGLFQLSTAFAAPAIKGPLVFISNVLEHTATIVEPATGAVRKIHTGALPHNWALSPDGREVLVVNTGSESVSFFDAATGAFKRHMLISPIPHNKYHDALPAGSFAGKTSCHECHGANAVGRLPGLATYTKDGKGLWTVGFNPPSVKRVDLLTGTQSEELKFKPQALKTSPSNLVYTPDGKVLIVVHRRESQAKLPASTPGQHAGMPPGGSYGAHGMGAFNHEAPAGIKASVVTFHTADGKTELGQLFVPLNLPFKMDFSADGKLLYIAYRSSNKVAEIDVAARKLKRILRVGEGPFNAVVDKRDGKWLYAPSFYDSPPEIVKLELKTGLVRALLPAKVSPAIVNQDRDTGLLYAVINANNRLLEIDPQGKGKILQDFPAGAFPLDCIVISESERRRALR